MYGISFRGRNVKGDQTGCTKTKKEKGSQEEGGSNLYYNKCTR